MLKKILTTAALASLPIVSFSAIVPQHDFHVVQIITDDQSSIAVTKDVEMFVTSGSTATVEDASSRVTYISNESNGGTNTLQITAELDANIASTAGTLQIEAIILTGTGTAAANNALSTTPAAVVTAITASNGTTVVSGDIELHYSFVTPGTGGFSFTEPIVRRVIYTLLSS